MLKFIRCFKVFFITIIISLLWTHNSPAQVDKLYLLRTVAFYNVENLFDTENDPFIFDDDRTPTGNDKWTILKYEHKLKNLSRVISEIGGEISQLPPAILGVCEVENLKVLEDLVIQPALISYNYGIIHYDSPDRRGIDVGLLYQKDLFIPQHSQSRRLLIYEADDPSKRVYTRDQLVVSGLFEGEPMHFIVNHWPSRSGGEARSSYKRESAARLNRKIIDSLHQVDPYARIIIMGDFNDDPTNRSIRKVLGTKADKGKTGIGELFNPMESMLRKGMGTLAYRDGWNLFDQIILSHALLGNDYSTYQFYRAGIFNPEYLLTPSGQYKGYPFRSYDYGGYTGGYSDHFPVYVYLIKEVPVPLLLETLEGGY
ncbi:endonuclease/exonuclease/phosphatase family protein [Antarcticibacterium arcticum]|uniref:Endonuclease/exonuclease/phosphatase family protein n=1 Tax=Antarcticibacterium arcticum TaxID=2585771 RepID=A0A5B8YPT9_9FLAO|nr:endonuclease/exonuclease/phosphatase family protein [Antarcticibacterium arcticum]